MITLALSKGRIFEELLPFLAAAGIRPLENPEESRKLMIDTNRSDLRIVVLRATDVPTYVQYGAADMGVTGWDTLYEHGGNGLCPWICRLPAAACVWPRPKPLTGRLTSEAERASESRRNI